MKKLFKYFLICLGGCTLLASTIGSIIYYCTPIWYGQEKEVYRLSSPDNKHDVIVTIQEAGAFGSGMLRLFIMPQSTSLDFIKKNKINPCFRSEGLPVRFMKWETSTLLILKRYDTGRIYDFYPVHHFDLKNHKATILIKLESIDKK